MKDKYKQAWRNFKVIAVLTGLAFAAISCQSKDNLEKDLEKTSLITPSKTLHTQNYNIINNNYQIK
tara:strand:- start:723 stop:920 length:198 start_codon:yes stop_codon:yes gene_type:complete